MQTPRSATIKGWRLGVACLVLFATACNNQAGNTRQAGSKTPAANAHLQHTSQPESERATTQPARLQLRLDRIADDLTSPVALEFPNDGSNRMFVVSQTGIIQIVKGGKVLKDPFLDLRDKLDKPSRGYSEKGLLGLAFHPDYRNNGRFFVYYSAPTRSRGANHKSVVSEFRVSAGNPDKADTRERVVLEFDQPESNHNGGQLAFGPDGMLYIGSGDGGGGGDKHGSIGNGQNLNTLLGKILRININSKTPYTIPADNPFAGQADTRPEIWAYGLRNPWRFSFDRQSGDLLCADVGQNKYEEVNLIKKGGNYGWRIMEGNHCFDPPANCNRKGLEMPIFEYDHSQGLSVTGGYVYRGKKHPALAGKYVFGDWGGRLFVLTGSGSAWQPDEVTIAGKSGSDTDLRVNSFGQDPEGEIYLVAQRSTGPYSSSGEIYRIGL